MSSHDSTFASVESFQPYGASELKIRPTLKIDTSDNFLSSGVAFPNSHSDSPSSGSHSAHSPSHLASANAQTSNAKTPHWNSAITPRADPKIQQSNVEPKLGSPKPRPSNSPYPLGSHSEVDLALSLRSSVYDREIRFIDVEDKDGFKSIRTIIRPTSTVGTAASRPSRPSMISAVSSPLTSLFSRPSTPPIPKFKLHSAQSTDAPRAPWHMPSLGISTLKSTHRSSGTGTSSQSFEEEVDYLQAKLEKETMGGDGAIRIEMKVEISVSHIERQQRRRRPRWQFERHHLGGRRF